MLPSSAGTSTVLGGRPSTTCASIRLPRRGPSSSAAVMVVPTSWPEARACGRPGVAEGVRHGYSAAWPRGDVAGPDNVRQPCGDRAAIGVQSLGDVAGGALRVVVEVFDDAPFDVVLVLTRRGATVAGATRGRSTRRALRHQRQPDQRRIWRRWRGRPSTVRCVCIAEDLPTLWRCRATGEGTRPSA